MNHAVVDSYFINRV